jgi:hypothetical protein
MANSSKHDSKDVKKVEQKVESSRKSWAEWTDETDALFNYEVGSDGVFSDKNVTNYIDNGNLDYIQQRSNTNDSKNGQHNQKTKKSKLMHQHNKSYCMICMDDLEDGQKFIPLHKTRRQTHGLCSECMITYLKSSFHDIINSKLDGKNSNDDIKIKCCGNIKSKIHNKCDQDISLEFLSDIKSFNDFIQKDEDLYKMYTKLVCLSTPGTILCIDPKCQELIMDVPDDKKRIVCPTCSTVFCRKCLALPYHEHTRICSKDDILKRLFAGESGDIFEQYIASGKWKPCGSCCTLVEKIDGCNKVVCKCGDYFCWLCESVLDKSDPYAHFGEKCKLFT